MTAGHYTILWHPYDPERYAELRRWYTSGCAMPSDAVDEMRALEVAAAESPPWEDELHLLDLAHAEALLAAVQARVEQLRPSPADAFQGKTYTAAEMAQRLVEAFDAGFMAGNKYTVPDPSSASAVAVPTPDSSPGGGSDKGGSGATSTPLPERWDDQDQT